MNKVLKVFLVLLLIIFTYYVTLFSFPSLFLPLKVQKGNLTFYFKHRYEVDTFCFVDQKKKLNYTYEKIQESLKISPLYDSTTFRGVILLPDNYLLFDSFAFFQKHHAAFCLWKIDGQVVIIKEEVCDRMFDETSILITHELTHKVELEVLGKMKYAKTPKWLIEGYAEYVSHQGNVNMIFVSSNESEYNRYEVVVAYLLKVKKYSEITLFNNPPDYETVLTEIKKWRKINKISINSTPIPQTTTK